MGAHSGVREFLGEGRGDGSLCRVGLNGEGAFSLWGATPKLKSAELGNPRATPTRGLSTGLSLEEAAVCGSPGELCAPPTISCAGHAERG